MYNLARIYRQAGDTARELEFLNKCLESDPRFPLTYFYLARIHLNRGERYQEAIDLVKKGIDLKPEKTELPLGYFLLADLYNRIGDVVQSEEYARKGQVAAAVTASKQK
jgi:tetratricopeptide (TPR) repeat protein